MLEKRRFIRFTIAVKVDYIISDNPKIEKTGITRDISAGGMQLLTKDKLELGKKMEFKIFVPEALNPAHMNGRVVWSGQIQDKDKPEGFGTGIEFVDVEEDNKNTILRFLCDLMYKKIGKIEKGGG